MKGHSDEGGVGGIKGLSVDKSNQLNASLSLPRSFINDDICK